MVILDVNVFVSAIITPGGPADRLVAAAEVGEIRLVVSPGLLAELDDVLRREKFRRRMPLHRVGAYVDGVRRMAVVLPDAAPVSGHVRDRKDDYLVALAVAAGVDALVSGDKDLLAVEVVRVVTPREAVEEVGS